MAFLTLDDRSARMEVRVFSEVLERYRALVAKDKVLVVEGTLAFDDFSGSYQVTAQRIHDINQAREAYARRLVVGVESARAGNGLLRSLADVLTPFREGVCPVWISYSGAAASAQIALGDEWQVHPTDELIHRLQELAGEGRVEVVYR